MESVIDDHPPYDGRDWDCQCARCGSSMHWVDCEHCSDGFTGHDCGEDCCCCAEPEDNVVCDVCDGAGGWRECLSSFEYCIDNPLPKCEVYERSQIEWYCLDRDRAPDPELACMLENDSIGGC